MPSTTPDLANDILSLNRTTERMILSSFQFTTRKNKKTVEIIDDVLGMEWNEKTHQVTTTVTPATDHDPKTVTLTIQRGIPLAIEQGYIGQSFIREAENGGVPESVEPLFVRIGGECFKSLLENTWNHYIDTHKEN